MPNALDDMAHVSPETIIAYADGRIDSASRDEVERHLISCPDCRREVAEVVRLHRQGGRRWLLPAGALAAAAVLILAVQLGQDTPGPVDPSQLRDAQASGVAVDVVFPDTTMAVDSAARFVWRSVIEARYQFTLTAEGGTPIFSSATNDTMLVLPANVTLERGRTYLWFVDAIRSDGRTGSSGLRVLRTLP